MPSNTIEGYTFTVNDEGFFTNREEWNEPLAEILAGMIGIDELTPAHWAALKFMREDQAKSGVTPTLRRMQIQGKFDVKQLFVLFPGKPAKKMSYLAGLPKPVGCV
ncbi:MAG: TusE/DsrC/DsvC family sulfur relay protein [Propionibacteriaceae bacterium]